MRSYKGLKFIQIISTLLIRLNIQSRIRYSGLNRQYEVTIRPPLDCTSHTNVLPFHLFLSLFMSAILNYK